MLLIRNADLYDPVPRGFCDIVVAGGLILSVRPAGESPCGHLAACTDDLQVVDAKGRMVMPGIFDRHVHFNGAGGEGGPAFRTPPLQLSSFVRAGVTSVVGLLGTDGTCRSLEDLLMKARGLEAEGISTWILTGSYALPTATITGSVKRDLCLIDKIIGLKIALSDHRGSHPTVEELRRTASDARLGGIISGKAGCVCVHMGSEVPGLAPILEALEGTDIPIAQFAPTHIARTSRLVDQAAEYGRRGGLLDITAGMGSTKALGLTTGEVVQRLLSDGVPPGNITLSSDGNGSMPTFDAKGEMTGMGIGPIDAVLETIGELLRSEVLPRETAIALGTSNVADHLKLPRKGRLHPGCDGDLLVLDEDFRLRTVVAKGRVLMEEGEVLVKGTFE